MKHLRIKSGIAGRIDTKVKDENGVERVRSRSYVFEPGDLVEWEDDREADRLIDRNIAELIPSAAAAETISNKVGKVIKTHSRPQSEAAMRPAPVAR